VAQSTSDRDVALRGQQIMKARRLWENNAPEEALGQLFTPCLQRDVSPQLQSKLLIPMLNKRSKSLLAKLLKERLDKRYAIICCVNLS